MCEPVNKVECLIVVAVVVVVVVFVDILLLPLLLDKIARVLSHAERKAIAHLDEEQHGAQVAKHGEDSRWHVAHLLVAEQSGQVDERVRERERVGHAIRAGHETSGVAQLVQVPLDEWGAQATRAHQKQRTLHVCREPHANGRLVLAKVGRCRLSVMTTMTAVLHLSAVDGRRGQVELGRHDGAANARQASSAHDQRAHGALEQHLEHARAHHCREQQQLAEYGARVRCAPLLAQIWSKVRIQFQMTSVFAMK